MAFDDWSTTAGSNTTVGGVSIAEGMSPGGVNNAIRGLMAEVATYRDLIGGKVVSAGTADAQTVTTTMSMAAYAQGVLIAFEAGAALTNTGAMTVNVDAIGAKSVKLTTGANPPAGAVTAGGIYFIAYEATSGTLLLLNPSKINAAADITGDLPFANLAQGSALSVLGVTGNSTADNASIAAGSDHQVLRRSGTAVAFGAIDLSQTAATTNTLIHERGGLEADVSAYSGLVRITGGASSAVPYVVETAWTPVLTFATVGNLSVAYTTQVGRYMRIGALVIASCNILTSTFTHTSASGALQITGLPLATTATSGYFAFGPAQWRGITKANFTDVNAQMAEDTATVTFAISGSGQTSTSVTAADMPTGGTVLIRFTITYITDE